MGPHEEEGSGYVDAGRVEPGLRISEGHHGGAGKSQGHLLRRKEGFHPGNCRSKRERRVLKFLMPILNPEKPKRINLTLANTMFGALSGSRPVNWGLLIHESRDEGSSPHREEAVLPLPLSLPPLPPLRPFGAG